MKYFVLLSGLMISCLSILARDPPAPRLIVHPKPGRFGGNNMLSVYISVHPMGGYKELFVFKDGLPIGYAEDITSFFFYRNGIIYAASAVYGRSPGIFFFDPINRYHIPLLRGDSSHGYEITKVSERRDELTYSAVPPEPPGSPGVSHQLNYSALVPLKDVDGK
jgi:hypothetical protein